jgi:hypothetical protein
MKAAAKAAKMSNIKVCVVAPPQSVSLQPVQGKTHPSACLFDEDIYGVLRSFRSIVANLNQTLQFQFNVSIKIEESTQHRFFDLLLCS